MPSAVYRIIHQIVCAFPDTLAIQLVCAHKSKHQSHHNVMSNLAILLLAVRTANAEKLMAIPFAHVFKASLEHHHNVDQNVRLAVNVQLHKPA